MKSQQHPHPSAKKIMPLLQGAKAPVKCPPALSSFLGDAPQNTAQAARTPAIIISQNLPEDLTLTEQDDLESEQDWQEAMTRANRVEQSKQTDPRHPTTHAANMVGRSPTHALPSGAILGGVGSQLPRPKVSLPSGRVLGGISTTELPIPPRSPSPDGISTDSDVDQHPRRPRHHHHAHQHRSRGARREAEVELDGTTLVVKKRDEKLDILRGFAQYINPHSPLIADVVLCLRILSAVVVFSASTPYGAPILAQLRPLTRALQFPLQLELIIRKSVASCEMFVATRSFDNFDDLYSRVKDFPVSIDAVLRKFANCQGKPFAISSGQEWNTAMTRIVDIKDAVFFDEFGSITTEDNKEYIHQGILPLSPSHPEKDHFYNLYIPNWMHENEAPALNLSRYDTSISFPPPTSAKRLHDDRPIYPQKKLVATASSSETITYGNRNKSFTSRREKVVKPLFATISITALSRVRNLLARVTIAVIFVGPSPKFLRYILQPPLIRRNPFFPALEEDAQKYLFHPLRPPQFQRSSSATLPSNIHTCPVSPLFSSPSFAIPLYDLPTQRFDQLVSFPCHPYILKNHHAALLPRWSRNMFQNPNLDIVHPSALGTETQPPLPQPPLSDIRYKKIMASLSQHKVFTTSTPIHIDLFRQAFKTHPNPEFIHSVCEALIHGMYSGDGDLDRPRSPRIRQHCPSSPEDLLVISQTIRKEIPLGCVIHFPGPTLPDYCSTVSLFVNRVAGKKDRLIHDLSYPSLDSFNDHIPDLHARVQYDTIQHTIPILRSAHRYCPPDSRVILWKTDIHGAFRLLPQHILLQSLQIILTENNIYIDKRVSFGSRSGPFWWCAISHLINWYLVNILHLPTLVMMDDFWGVTYQVKSETNNPQPRDMQLAQSFIASLGIPLSLEKDIWGPSIPVVGYQIDAMKMELSLTSRQVTDLLEFLDIWLEKPLQPRRLGLWSKLTGYLNWAANIFLRLKSHFCPIYSQMTSKLKVDSFPLHSSTLTSLHWIRHHITSMHPIRYLELETWTPDQADFHVFADATLQGFAFWFPHQNLLYYFHQTHPFHYSDGNPLIIQSVELYVQLVAVSILSRSVSRVRILLHTNNTGVFANLDSLHTSVPLQWEILQALNDIEISSSFSIRPQCLSTVDNVFADLGSRGDVVALGRLCPKLTLIPLQSVDLPSLPSFASVFAESFSQ
ncbi:hypothetical protein BDR26DRAFT_999556 [Obelidium mucronatum]|nr:hypothetical protein BDR26DRAFT_999556 [Obelidium mucronatum]